MRTIGFRLTNVSTGTLFLSDIPDARVLTAWRKPGPLYIGPGGTVELIYTGSTALSFELGSIRGFVNQGLLTAEFIEGEGVPGGTQLVYAPTATGDEGNYVFNDFGELYAKFQETPGYIEIYFDLPSGLPPLAGFPPEFRSFPVPAASYDFENRAMFIGNLSSILAIAVPEAGTEIRHLNGVSGAVGIYNETAAPVVIGTDIVGPMPEVFFLRDNATLAVGPGAAPVLRLDESVLGLDSGRVQDPFLVGTGVVEVASGSVGIISTVGALSEIQADTIVGDGTTSLVAFIGTASVDVDITTQSGFLGAIVEILNEDASQLLYTPADLADWSGTDPGNVAEALDRIAAALGPIA